MLARSSAESLTYHDTRYCFLPAERVENYIRSLFFQQQVPQVNARRHDPWGETVKIKTLRLTGTPRDRPDFHVEVCSPPVAALGTKNRQPTTSTIGSTQNKKVTHTAVQVQVDYWAWSTGGDSRRAAPSRGVRRDFKATAAVRSKLCGNIVT